MKALLWTLLAGQMLFPAWETEAAPWLTDFAAARATAKAEGKMVLLNFTGSDWCPWCIRLRNEVFAKPEFEAYANENLVLVEVDFPRRKVLSVPQRQANDKLATALNVTGYPTIIILDSEGQPLAKLGYMAGGPQPFIGTLQRLPGAKRPGASKAPEKPPPPPEPLPLFGGAPTQPPPIYNDLILKGISGPANRRLALINNQTLAAGESALVRLGESELRIRCEEIREQSVIVTISGSPERRELRLRGGW